VPTNLLQLQTTLGHFSAYLSDEGLLALTCPYPTPHAALKQLLAMLPSGVPLSSGPPPPGSHAGLARSLENYARRKPPSFTLPLDPRSLSPFDRKVLTALFHVPFGSTVTYAALAAAAGVPRAARATGQAVGRNRWSIILPCHRVVAADGTLGGFGAGLNLKRMLLRHEGLDPRALHPAKFITIPHQGGPAWSAG